MTSKHLALSMALYLFLSSYLMFFLLGMVNLTYLSKVVACLGLIPIVIYIVIWLFFSYRPHLYRPYHHTVISSLIMIYSALGILSIGASMQAPFPEKGLFIGIQASFLLIAYGLGTIKFNPKSSARELRKSARQQKEQIHIVGNGVALQGSYDRKPKYQWLNRIYTTGKTLFYLAILPLALLGGGAGLVMLRLLESTDLGVNGVSPHSMIIYFCSLFFAIMVGFAGPAVRFNFQWWRELDAKVRQEYGHVEYVWERDKG